MHTEAFWQHWTHPGSRAHLIVIFRKQAPDEGLLDLIRGHVRRLGFLDDDSVRLEVTVERCGDRQRVLLRVYDGKIYAISEEDVDAQLAVHRVFKRFRAARSGPTAISSVYAAASRSGSNGATAKHGSNRAGAR